MSICFCLGNREYHVTLASSKHTSVFFYNPIIFLQLSSVYRDCVFLTLVGDLGPVCLLLIMYLCLRSVNYFGITGLTAAWQ